MPQLKPQAPQTDRRPRPQGGRVSVHACTVVGALPRRVPPPPHPGNRIPGLVLCLFTGGQFHSHHDPLLLTSACMIVIPLRSVSPPSVFAKSRRPVPNALVGTASDPTRRHASRTASAGCWCFWGQAPQTRSGCFASIFLIASNFGSHIERVEASGAYCPRLFLTGRALYFAPCTLFRLSLLSYIF